MNINCQFTFQTQQAEKEGGRPGDAVSIVYFILSIFSYFYMYATCVKHTGAFVCDETFNPCSNPGRFCHPHSTDEQTEAQVK